MKTTKSLTDGDLSFKYVLDMGSFLGFSVSSKYGTSVQRSLFKRRCRSVFREVFVKNGNGIHVSIIVRPKSNNISYPSIFTSFSSVYEKIVA